MKAKSEDIPLFRLSDRGSAGFMVKEFIPGDMKSDIHRDEYYIFAFLERGNASVEIDFEQYELSAGEGIFICPFQEHRFVESRNDPVGRMLALTPEFLSESDTDTVDSFALRFRSFSLYDTDIADLKILMDMLRRHSSPEVTVRLAAAMKSILLSRIRDLDPHSSDRYRSIMVRFRRLLNGMPRPRSRRRPTRICSISRKYISMRL